MVEHQFSKLRAGVRFPYPAQNKKPLVGLLFVLHKNYAAFAASSFLPKRWVTLITIAGIEVSCGRPQFWRFALSAKAYWGTVLPVLVIPEDHTSVILPGVST